MLSTHPRSVGHPTKQLRKPNNDNNNTKNTKTPKKSTVLSLNPCFIHVYITFVEINEKVMKKKKEIEIKKNEQFNWSENKEKIKA